MKKTTLTDDQIRGFAPILCPEVEAQTGLETVRFTRRDTALSYAADHGGRYRAETAFHGLTFHLVEFDPDPGACAHESATTADGHGAFCRFCGEGLA